MYICIIYLILFIGTSSFCYTSVHVDYLNIFVYNKVFAADKTTHLLGPAEIIRA